MVANLKKVNAAVAKFTFFVFAASMSAHVFVLM